MPAPQDVHRTTTQALSVALILVGVAIVVRTLAAGGGVFGFLIGPLFVAAGAARLWLSRRGG
jgi:hypothetical protein